MIEVKEKAETEQPMNVNYPVVITKEEYAAFVSKAHALDIIVNFAKEKIKEAEDLYAVGVEARSILTIAGVKE